MSFSPPVRVANPIVRDNRFLFGTADHLDSFGAFRLDRQDILPYNPETCSSGGEAEIDYTIMFA